MTNPTNQALLRLAKAFDGIAGALHDGVKIPSMDLANAVRAAHELHPRHRPTEGPSAQDFEEARFFMERDGPAAVTGDAKACAGVERAAMRLAADLRWYAGHTPLVDKPPVRGPTRGKAAPFMPAPVAHQLMRRYARYALRPLA